MHSVEELDRKPICNNMIITKVDPTNFTEIRNFDAEKYRLVREVMPEKIENLIAYVETLRKGQNKKIFMIIDDTMLRRSSRRKYLTLSREYHWGYLEVFVKVEVGEAVKWDASRPANKQVGKRVIEKSLEQLDIVPNKYLLVWDKEDKKLETFEGKIKVPVTEIKPEQKNIDSFNSVLYDCMDLGARKCIGDILKGGAGEGSAVEYLSEFQSTLDS
jgi:predicted kinase